PAPLPSLRKMIHSTSLRATGSEIVASMPVALSASPLRRLSMPLLTSATSGSEVCGIGACAGGTAGGLGRSVLASCGPDAALARGEAPREPGRARGRGTAAALVLPDGDFFSLDLADAVFFAAGFATFAVAADGLLLPP